MKKHYILSIGFFLILNCEAMEEKQSNSQSNKESITEFIFQELKRCNDGKKCEEIDHWGLRCESRNEGSRKIVRGNYINPAENSFINFLYGELPFKSIKHGDYFESIVFFTAEGRENIKKFEKKFGVNSAKTEHRLNYGSRLNGDIIISDNNTSCACFLTRDDAGAPIMYYDCKVKMSLKEFLQKMNMKKNR